jgi:uncharacterized membrane protein YesL
MADRRIAGRLFFRYTIPEYPFPESRMSLFSQDSKFMRFVERLVDVMFLNLLWIAFSLPLFSIGASTTAAYYVALKMVDDEEGPIFRNFWKAFKVNFRQGTLLWFLTALAGYALYLDWQFATKGPNPPLWLIILSILSAVIVFCALIYAYPQVARYKNSLPNILRNSFRMSVRYYVRTLILIAVLSLEVFLFMWNVPMIVFGALVGPMIMIYTVSGISKKIFLDVERTGGKRSADKSAT